ncbi:FAD-dependent oxidoreductase [Ramlibacter rhizophilus]|uniref:FAD-dependent oxidoreductase n=1 Tax=Ramlibacter rhizophilus TaxID=1781167 RepID=A0A4Z0BC67_9BURK|nr:FAD-dependent oxidoreductase [Ramlibacter rhizophilus]TFY96826.1 FAD-dependent oxidoreductase [Ramlibacter rhizophilus]
MGRYAYPKFPYTPPDDLRASPGQRHPLVIVGAGPVGLAAAIDARLKGLPVLLLDEDDSVSVGSRAVCYAKRALEILDRLGVGEGVCDKGVGWNVGRTFFGEQEVYRFDLVPEPGHQRPGMINLQQYHLEEMLVARARELGVDMRWKYKVVSVQPQADHVLLRAETPDGLLELQADWLIAADGARSPLRRMLGLDIEGRIFMDRFLIADVVMQADYPAERWLWFDPPFHRHQTVLLHKQSDNIWRIDFQLGWDADPEEEKKPENVIPRLRAMLGDDRPFELEWVSIYTFQCRRMKDFRAGRVLFVGDAAHQVSPFGARGANSGFQDTDDLMWKLALVMKGLAPESLLDTYSQDRSYAADENIANSTRSTDFITPKTRVSKTFRNAVLDLARDHAFARTLVNSGRLSVPSFLVDSRLNTPDAEAFAGDMVPGAPAADAPVRENGREGWLLPALGDGFKLLVFAPSTAAITPAQRDAFAALAQGPVPIDTVVVTPEGGEVTGLRVLGDPQGLAMQRFDATPGAFYLMRPDQHVAARWRRFDTAAVRAALARAICNA